MKDAPTNEQALLEPTSERVSPNSTLFEDVEDDFSKSTAKSYWYLQVLVLGFLALHMYTVVMLCVCPLGNIGNSSAAAGLGADGYGQCLHGGIVPTPWSTTSLQGWLNVTVDVSNDTNPGWWKGIVVLSVFVVSLFFFVGSYSKASWSDPGYVMHLSKHEEALEDHNTYCGLCNIYKPPRCHHCSRCDRCVLKMDHHCIWINNCVGLYNYKHFFQLLCHGMLGTSFIIGLITWRIVHVYTHHGAVGLWSLPGWQLAVLLVGGVFAILQLLGICYLFQFHVRLVSSGRTNVEQVFEYWRKEDTNYDRGCAKNCVLALDSPVLCWLNPFCGLTRQYVRRNFDVTR